MYTINFTSQNSPDYRGYDQPKAQKNMGSKMKTEKDITPEFEGHGNHPKKRKMDSLLLVIPSQFAASTGYEYMSIIHNLVGTYPTLHVVKTEDCVIDLLSNIGEFIEVLESVGAALIFNGDAGDRKYGFACWRKALKLRESNGISNTTFPQSEWEKLALRNKHPSHLNIVNQDSIVAPAGTVQADLVGHILR